MTNVKEYLISDKRYFPNTQAERTDKLPAGAYECQTTMEGAPFFQVIDILTDKIIDIPNSVTEQVVEEVSKFWSGNVTQKLQDYGFVNKRGIILSGPPGTGKTITLAKTAEYVINELNGIVLFNPSPSYLSTFLRLIKDIEPDKKIMVMWEEFDSILRGSESELLSLLDGEIQVGNIVYLATTNYISRIPARIKNRPSRFARVIEVLQPSAEARRAFLEAKLLPADKHHLEAMVEATDGFVMDQLKDIIISVCCFNYSISDAVLKIKEMQEESMGVDDYQEEQTKSFFSSSENKPFKKGPLKPIK